MLLQKVYHYYKCDSTELEKSGKKIVNGINILEVLFIYLPC